MDITFVNTLHFSMDSIPVGFWVFFNDGQPLPRNLMVGSATTQATR